MTAERPTTERLREAAEAVVFAHDHSPFQDGLEYAVKQLREALAAAPVDRDGLREALVRAQHSVNIEVGACDHDGGHGDCEEQVDELLHRAALSAPEPKDRPDCATCGETDHSADEHDDWVRYIDPEDYRYIDPPEDSR
jgi:hypothetical protein